MDKTLNELLNPLGIQGDADINITGIQFDSRKIKAGNLFVAISGYESDGHKFIESAIQNGAVVIIGEKELQEKFSVPYVQVRDSREALSNLANHFYDNPHNKHKMIGITGTNGKTTTSYLIHHILNHHGKTVARLGTVEYVINGNMRESSLTTPDAILLQQMLHESEDEYVVMEVSSHGLDQYRVHGPMFDYAVFTNLSHEHLDYHKDLESYYLAKKRLFRCLKNEGKGIVGTYSSWGNRLQEELAEELIPSLSFGQTTGGESIYLKSYQTFPDVKLVINDNGEEHIIKLNIQGEHNVYNALGSYICAREIGLTPREVIEGLETFKAVPGRFEEVSLENGAKAFIDYAHTPDGLQYALRTAKECTERNLYHLFGFRGKRDPSKRATMVEISQNISDFVFLTLDDLNGTDKELMLAELRELSKPYENIVVIDDRTEAIAYVLSLLQKGDGLIVTGKGPENYKEEYRYKTLNDKDTILKILQENLLC
ncbi:UDP-N-acetylmuramoyl-L-alanyl-D-glutamate--2,6-diaminopimelate ligase [Halalkalibacter akibai]|uniref:UDP-N-acetylmuramyl-tripeptide synthetase n=1 Tax=Halalkalibacter akibai (strain ATCC 43226 / DSM 21942 / CIP 109018 / JCM 9157 / 1139) TaxID=1236973 RepID=W4QW38_HALA3|nr:UDP-N-acetylmuramoyl-L-alanyl-D-glutamate--2,6-diaminopimelate ligase [Halalkalibacter akibai]GAE36112.1 UDP-N-acetylmuramoylalanyl-D-glutamate-2,6-diaminopimelate ligase [Halalkalibacter akibai JCM 9157]